jgi:conjugative transfer pilus assembly protein TraH
MKWLVYILLVFIMPLVQADINDDLMKFFEQSGMPSNISTPSTFQDQAAGYYSGGSAMIRARTRPFQPASVQLPGIRAGCGGIDMWGGSFSHIGSEEFMRFIRSIGQNAVGFAGMLAIKTMTPQIAGLLQDLNHLATTINTSNINSCELAATMVGSIWPKSQHVQDTLCQTMSTDLGFFSDRAQSRHGCGQTSNQNRVWAAKNKDPRYKNILVGNYNLAWNVLQKQTFLQSDTQLAELFMTLTGTLISRQIGQVDTKEKRQKEDNGTESIVIPGQAHSESLIQALLYGGNVTLYCCQNDTKSCLHPQEATISIQSGLLSKVLHMLQTLENKTQRDTGKLTDQELAFLNATSLPIYKMLNVSSYYRRGKSPLDVKAYAELVAYDLLFQYVEGIIDMMHHGLAQIRPQQVDDHAIQSFIEHLRDLRVQLTQRQGGAYQKLDRTLQLVEQTKLIEQQTHHLWGKAAPL